MENALKNNNIHILAIVELIHENNNDYQSKRIYRVFIVNCGEVVGNNAAVYQVI